MSIIKKYQIIIAAIIIAVSCLWHAQNGRYQIAVFSQQDFVRLDTRTGDIELCVLDPKNCYPWEKYRLEESDERAKHYKMLVEKKMKEAGLSN